MFRQLTNLRRFGRLRTSAPTPRSNKPEFLRRRPDCEIANLLEFVTNRVGKPPGEFFFVQIGAFDGKQGDALYGLVHRFQWRGILVEPQPDAFVLLQQNYATQPQLQFFNVAIGPQSGELTLYSREGGTSIASTERHLLVKPGISNPKIIERKVPCWTFQQLLAAAHAPAEIDLLQIDCESYDFEIIKSIDFSRCRPCILRFEHTLLPEWDRNACLELLAAQGYRFLLEDMDTMAILTEQIERCAA